MAQTFLVVGCGSIGQRHIRNLGTLGAGRVLAYDSDQTKLAEATRETDAHPVDSLEQGFAENPTAVLVCTPPDKHLYIALQAVDAGAHLFVEKPIAPTAEGCDALISAASDAGRILMVGYNLRFQTGIEKMHELVQSGEVGKIFSIRAEFGQYLPDWRPGSDYRTGYYARAESGGGILLDASHELDYMTWIAGQPETIYALIDRKSDLEIETEDLVLLLMRLESGAFAEVHLDVLEHGYTRRCKIVGSLATLEWDFNTGVTIRRIGCDTTQKFPTRDDVNDMYLQELAFFLRCLSGETTPPVDGRRAVDVLRMVEAAKDSAREGREVNLP
jgi:predicted dehydrogenase